MTPPKQGGGWPSTVRGWHRSRWLRLVVATLAAWDAVRWSLGMSISRFTAVLYAVIVALFLIGMALDEWWDVYEEERVRRG